MSRQTADCFGIAALQIGLEPCRSLKQLKKEVAEKLAKKAAAAKAKAELAVPPPTPAGLYDSESDVEMSPGPVSTKQIKVVATHATVQSCATHCEC